MTSHKYSNAKLVEVVANNTSYSGVLRDLGIPLAGGNHTHIKQRIQDSGIDTTHFLGKGQNKNKVSPKRKSADSILILLPPGSHRPKTEQLRRGLLERGVPEVCAECGQGTVWNNKFLQLEVDHISGNWLDCREGNLRFLDSNCHSQQKTTNLSWKNRV